MSDAAPSRPSIGAAAGSIAAAVGAPRNALTLPRPLLDQRFKDADPVVGQLLHDHALQLLQRMGSDDPLLDATRRALARGLGAGDASPETIAQAIGVSARTLRRKLAALSTTYQALRDEQRCALACQLLGHGWDSIDAIATRLGFATRSGFERAFRRCMGVSPSRYRARQRAAPNAGAARTRSP